MAEEATPQEKVPVEGTPAQEPKPGVESTPEEETPKELTQEEVENLQKENEELTGANVALTSSVTELRTKLQEERAGNAAAPPVETPPTETPVGQKPDEVKELVLSTLAEERRVAAKENGKKALHKFWEVHPEFNPANDTTGLRAEALDAALKRLNTAGSSTVDEIISDYEDALKLMGQSEKGTTPESVLDAHASSSPVSHPPTSTPGGGKLTSKQEKLARDKGWSVEKYLNMKDKYPTVIP